MSSEKRVESVKADDHRRLLNWFRRHEDFWVALPLIVLVLVFLALRIRFSLKRYYEIELFSPHGFKVFAPLLLVALLTIVGIWLIWRRKRLASQRQKMEPSQSDDPGD